MNRPALLFLALVACGPGAVAPDAPLDAPPGTLDAPPVAPDARPLDAPLPDAPRPVDAPLPDAPAPSDAPSLPDAGPRDAGVLASSVAPASGSVISARQALTLSFAEALTQSSAVLGGNLAQVAVKSFPTPTQLVVAPATTWPEGNATLTVTVSDELGDQARLTLLYVIDATPPTATLRTGGFILDAAQESLTIRYSETMREPSLRVGGSLAALVTPQWSGFMAEDDTLAIDPPTGGWPDGGTLTVDATDLAGNAAPTLKFQVKLAP